MKKLKIINYLLPTILVVSCTKKSVREDILERYPTQKIDTILSFDFDKNGMKDNIVLLVTTNRENSIALYMNNKFIVANNRVIPKSISGYEHFINLKNRDNSLVIEDNFSTTRPKEYYRLVFNYNKALNKVILDSFIGEGRVEDKIEMPYFKNFVRKNVSKNKILSIEKDNFITKDSLDFKKF